MKFTAEQLAQRAEGTGASELGAAVGLDPHATALDVFLRKTGAAPESEDTDETVLGTCLEPGLVDWVCWKLKAEARDVLTRKHPVRPYLFATPDRLLALPTGEVCILEVKTSAAWHLSDEWGTPGSDQVPMRFVCQTQSQMDHFDLDRTIVLALLHGRPRIYVVERDRELMDILDARNRVLWEEHILKGIPPPPDGTENFSEHLKRRHPRPMSELLAPTTPEVDQWVAEFRAAHAEATAAAKRKKQAQQCIELVIGDGLGIQGPWGRVTWPVVKDGLVTDWDAVATEAGIPEDLILRHTTTKPGHRRFTHSFKGEK